MKESANAVAKPLCHEPSQDPPGLWSAADTDFDYEEALLACARGERFALQSIYARDARWLYAVAYRITRRRELAEEVLHDAMVKVWQGAKQYAPEFGSARGWVYTVVRNHALNLMRREYREVSCETLELPELGGEGKEELMQEASKMHACLAHLDEAKRNAIMLAFMEGYTHEQVSQRLNAPLGSVKSWIRRGLLKLRECLG